MAKGRKPTPTEMKKQIGTARADRILENEWKPEGITNIPTPSAGSNFDEISKEVWYRHLYALTEANVITSVDIEQFEIYVLNLQRHRKMEEKINEEGEIIFNDKGVPMINPAVRVLNMAADKVIRLAGEFGLTPSSRTRIGTTGKVKNGGGDDQFSKLGI